MKGMLERCNVLILEFIVKTLLVYDIFTYTLVENKVMNKM